MDVTLSTWIAVPLIGGLIGYVTNRIAVKMIFRPIRPRRFLGLRIQGLIGRRQPELARSIGAVVSDHLVNHEDVIRSFAKVDLESLLADVLERGMAKKVADLRNLPLIGGFLTEERITELRHAIVREILKQKEVLIEKLEEAVEQGLDIEEMVRHKVEAFPVAKLEQLVLQVASKELRAIEILGGVLGLLIGVAQVLVIGYAGS
ncbi:MAG: DUF445 family protein [Planctomycetes bacterium]|nr:DUF445 family protein [Planctomycetota bacterium]